MTENTQVMEKLTTALEALAPKPEHYEWKPTGKLRYRIIPSYRYETVLDKAGGWFRKPTYKDLKVAGKPEKVLEQEFQRYMNGTPDGAPYWEPVKTKSQHSDNLFD